MPNWCNNTLVLKHKDPKMIERAAKAFTAGKFCEEFVPIPEALKDTTAPAMCDEDSEALEEKYGYPDWYSFCVNEWGTKWDVGSEDGINELTAKKMSAYFDSAWAPPIALMEKLDKLGFTVELNYYESGMCFVGYYKTNKGNKEYKAIPGECPKKLDDMWGITELHELFEEEAE